MERPSSLEIRKKKSQNLVCNPSCNTDNGNLRDTLCLFILGDQTSKRRRKEKKKKEKVN